MPGSGAPLPPADVSVIGREALLESPFAAAISAFYRARFYRPVWVTKGVIDSDGRTLLETLLRSHEQGIELLDTLRPWSPASAGPLSDDQLLSYDQNLTHLFLRYAYAVRLGRILPSDAGMIWAIPTPSFDAAQLLDALNHRPFADLVKEQPPPHAGYAALASALIRYRQIDSQGGWPHIPEGTVLEPGRLDRRVGVLRRRLEIEGYGPILAGEPDRFDAALTRAVEIFQTRHGLARDGRVGPETLAALNISAERRVEQIKLNMERWRWLPRELPARRIEVNIAAAELELFDQGRPVLSMKTIVGSPRHPTPVLRGELRAVIVNPEWNVPDSIVRNEIIPRLRRDPDYLRAQNIRILDRPEDPFGIQIDWRRGNGGTRPRLQQQPGPLNALGWIKFDMPNPFDVYLHDTPSRALFDRPIRTLSHGCVRLQFPDRLAAFLLDDREMSFSTRIGEAHPTRLALDARVPVFLLYWTAFATADGTLQFRRDVYDYDDKMRIALKRAAGSSPIASVAPGGCPIS